MPTHDDLVRDYIEHAEAMSLRGEKTHFSPACDEVDDLVRQDPETAWPLVLELIRRATSDEVLAYVAAGPLENLLCEYGEAFIDRVEAPTRCR